MIFEGNIIDSQALIKDALVMLNQLQTKESLTLFVVDNENKLIGTLTDGDIRRGLLKGSNLESSLEEVLQPHFKYLQRKSFTLNDIAKLKENEINLIPFVNEKFQIEKIIDLSQKKSILPCDAVIMAGGEGIRLRPLTLETPKPLIKVGDKPILEYNIDRLSEFGIDNIFISIKYLGEKIVDYFADGTSKNISIKYVRETDPLGTVGALSLVKDFQHDTILIMNSDILTNIDYEDLYRTFEDTEADMLVATIPYLVTLPYGIIESRDNRILGVKEKPTFTYYCNAGIYLIKRQLLNHIPNCTYYNATDLIEALILKSYNVVNYPILTYWLDIGKHEDYIKAQQDIKHLRF